jgi:hypothetical protein
MSNITASIMFRGVPDITIPRNEDDVRGTERRQRTEYLRVHSHFNETESARVSPL